MKRRPAFTLIEILIVIFIIGILAVVAISSYGAARQRAKADLIADTLLNTIKEQQNAAQSGQGTVPLCYGVYFDANSQPQVQTVTAPYQSISTDQMSADYCDMNNKNLQDFTALENFTITDVNAFGTSQNSYLIMFKPPQASVVGGDLNTPQSLEAQSNSMITISFQSADGLEKRTIGFDVATGRAQNITETPANPTQ